MFINEYVSAEDVIKYNLKEAVFRYVPGSKSRLTSEPSNLMWTIDKKQNIFLIPMKSGREEFSNRLTWMFYCNGHECRVETDKCGSPDQNLSDSPYYVNWNIVEISPISYETDISEHMRTSLIDALVNYGYGGARKQLPNTVVTVNINCN